MSARTADAGAREQTSSLEANHSPTSLDLKLVACSCCAILSEGALAVGERAPLIVFTIATRSRDGYVAAEIATRTAYRGEYGWWIR